MIDLLNKVAEALEGLDELRWRIPTSYKLGMRVPRMVFADEYLVEKKKTDRQTAKPNPCPLDFVVNKGVKSLGFISSDMPTPVSSTVMTTSFASRLAFIDS